jgi:D-aminopeptidase
VDNATNKRPRLRDLGVEIGTLPPGPLNAITDVAGVRVGQSTVIAGAGAPGQPAVRTGVTAIHPHEGSVFRSMVPASIAVLNGAGEITGRSQVDEFGYVETPILITNTLSVGAVHQATVEWLCQKEPTIGAGNFVVPVVAETYDGFLNDTTGQHVEAEHVFAALDGAAGGPVAEGNVGGGTGMMLFNFKGGNGTSSRLIEIGGASYTVGVFVQGNFGARQDLLVDGVPVGLEISDLQPEGTERPISERPKEGSVIVVIATDAPLSGRQLGRLCRRGMLGLSRTGAIAGNSSGDLLIAFSNTPENRVDRFDERPLVRQTRLRDEAINPLFRATVDATAEAVLNALVAAETMVGHLGNVAHALPHDRLREIMRRYGRLGDD